jgi:hypothetical protein
MRHQSLFVESIFKIKRSQPSAAPTGFSRFPVGAAEGCDLFRHKKVSINRQARHKSILKLIYILIFQQLKHMAQNSLYASPTKFHPTKITTPGDTP